MKSLAVLSFPLGGKRWQIHALGAFHRNVGDANNHTIEVFLTCLDSLGKLGYQFQALAPIGLLPALKIGSVWKNKWQEPDEPAHLGAKLQLQVDPGAGRTVQAKDHADFFRRRWLLPREIEEGGYFVQTTGRYRAGERVENCTVLVPCPVVFAQFYGVTTNLAVLLSRHVPAGKLWERIYFLEAQLTDAGVEMRSFYDQTKGRVHVCLGTCVEDAGYRQVAWFFHEKLACSEAKDVPNRLSTAPSGKKGGQHLRIHLPFTSGTEFDCYGVWDERTHTVLVHRITWCGYQMVGVRMVTFDRENDARPAQRVPPGARYERRPKDGSPPPRKEAATTPPEGGVVAFDPPRGDQQFLTWKDPDPMELSSFIGGKVPKSRLRTNARAPSPPLSDDEIHELLGCGERAHTAVAKPGLLVQPPSPPSADAVLKSAELLSQIPEDGFRYILEVLKMLLAEGWQLGYALSRRIIFDLDPKLNPKLLKKRPQNKVLAVKLSCGLTRFILIEFALPGKSTATIMVWAQDTTQGVSTRSLLNIVLSGLTTWKEIKPELEFKGWKSQAFRHQSLRAIGRQVVAPENRIYTFAESVRHHGEKLLVLLNKTPE